MTAAELDKLLVLSRQPPTGGSGPPTAPFVTEPETGSDTVNSDLEH